MEYKLTSVKILKELYRKFKAKTLDDEFTLQKLVNRTMNRYIKEEDYRQLIIEYDELEVSGSTNF